MPTIPKKEIDNFLKSNPNNPATRIKEQSGKTCSSLMQIQKDIDMITVPNHTRIYEDHEISDIYPLCGDDEIRKMAQSILEHGQLCSIKLFSGKILDGRNRYRACKIAGVDPYFENWDGTYFEAIEYVSVENKHRIHLTNSPSTACLVLKKRQKEL
jgi:hypothetical protein